MKHHLKDNKNVSESQVISSEDVAFQNKSNDWRYFTVVPNWILDNLSVYDAMLYIHIKRIAGENGQCWVSLRYFAQKLNISLGQVHKSIQNLIKLGLIEEAGVKKVKTRPRKIYRIVDIWERNVDFYSSDKKIPQNSAKSEKVIHNQSQLESGDCSYSEQTPGDCSYSEQTLEDCSYSEHRNRKKSQKLDENQSISEEKQRPKKNQILLEEKPNIINNNIIGKDDVVDVDNFKKEKKGLKLNNFYDDSPKEEKRLITKGENLFKNTNIQPFIDKFGLDRVLYAMDMLNAKYSNKSITNPGRLLEKVLNDKTFLHNPYYSQFRDFKPGQIIPIKITCPDCKHSGLLNLEVGLIHRSRCSKCSAFVEVDLTVNF